MLSYSLHLQLYIIQSTEKTLVELLIAWCPWHFDENDYGKNLKGVCRENITSILKLILKHYFLSNPELHF